MSTYSPQHGLHFHIDFEMLPCSFTNCTKFYMQHGWGRNNYIQGRLFVNMHYQDMRYFPESQGQAHEGQEGQRCPKRRVAQADIRLVTAIIRFRNKERNVRSPS